MNTTWRSERQKIGKTDLKELANIVPVEPLAMECRPWQRHSEKAMRPHPRDIGML